MGQAKAVYMFCLQSGLGLSLTSQALARSRPEYWPQPPTSRLATLPWPDMARDTRSL